MVSAPSLEPVKPSRINYAAGGGGGGFGGLGGGGFDGLGGSMSNPFSRGRDASYLAPPAQIRTCSFPAYGSYLGCVTAKRLSGHG